jgi:2'-5' RNA ligase
MGGASMAISLAAPGPVRQAGGVPRIRLGVVLLVPPPFDAEIDGLRRAFGDTTRTRIAPHVTLVSPINVRSERLDEAVGTVRAAAARRGPLALVVGPVATFAPVTPVAYLAVGGDLEALADLRAAVATGPLARADRHPWVPHVTVADDLAPDRIEAAVRAGADYAVGWPATRVHVMAEQPDRRWLPIADAGLSRPAVVGRGGLPLELAVHDVPSGAAGRWTVTARRDGSVIGAASGAVRGGWCLVDEITVAVPGEGVGGHVLAAVESLAAERGCEALVHLADGATAAFLRQRGWVDGPSALVRRLVG